MVEDLEPSHLVSRRAKIVRESISDVIGAVGKVACLGVEFLLTILRVGCHGWVLNVLYAQRLNVVCNLMVDDWQWLPEI